MYFVHYNVSYVVRVNKMCVKAEDKKNLTTNDVIFKHKQIILD